MNMKSMQDEGNKVNLPKRFFLPAVCSLLICASLSCTSQTHSSSTGDARQVQETQTGLASFYSRSFEGKETASGVTFDNSKMVAAHPTYPFGTVVRVVNLGKGGDVEVRVVDSGPTDENRAEGVIIDLSRAAAEKLGMVKEGRERVRVEVLEWGQDERK